MIHRPLFTKLLISGLISELRNPFDDWLKSISPTNHPEDYVNCRLTQELKMLVNKALNVQYFDTEVYYDNLKHDTLKYKI